MGIARVRTAGMVLALAATVSAAWAQEPGAATTGTVRDTAGTPVAGAQVRAEPVGLEAVTGADGRFSLALAEGRYVLRVAHPAFVPYSSALQVTRPITTLDVVLQPLPRFMDDVVVAAVRAEAEVPVTKRTIPRTEIEQLNYGQEMPSLLQQLPSVTQYSDTGMGAGYSYLSLRGVPQTRMNVTLDGVPLNEPEDSAFYFANFGDFANAVESIQVQRGVGTSSVGAASLVGSVNFESIEIADDPQATVRIGAGSFGTSRVSAAGHSGDVGAGLRFYGQAAYQETDGFRRNSGVIQRSVYFGASQRSDVSFFKLFGFVGREQSELAFLATDADTLREDLRFNPLTPDNRDRFGQTFVQGQYHRAIGTDAELSVQAYYNGADGWYRISDTRAQPSGLFEYGLDWRSVGLAATYRLTRGAWGFTWGTYANDFASHHARDIYDGPPDYANRGFKNEANTFVKVSYDRGRWHHYGDAQVRWARFRFEGDLDLGSVDWTFFNPKVGTRYALTSNVSMYASIGSAGREPGRLDMLQGEDNPTIAYDLEAVRPERVVDVEGGAEFVRPGLSARATIYFMEFRDEIALTGELSETGLPTRRNVDESFRRGLELDVRWEPTSTLRLAGTSNVNLSRISQWRQFYDVYDAEGRYVTSTSLVHTDVPPLLTPAFLANLSADYVPTSWLGLGTVGRYVSRMHLDNAGSDQSVAPAFFALDASGWLDLGKLLQFAAAAQPRLRVQVNNVLNDHELFPSGYSYLYFVRGAGGSESLETINYYYPQATRSVFAALELRF